VLPSGAGHRGRPGRLLAWLEPEDGVLAIHVMLLATPTALNPSRIGNRGAGLGARPRPCATATAPQAAGSDTDPAVLSNPSRKQPPAVVAMTYA
jgi:hypothetical protein